MADIIHLHKRAGGAKPKQRSFEPLDQDATILMFTGVRYERDTGGITSDKEASKSGARG